MFLESLLNDLSEIQRMIYILFKINFISIWY